MAIDINSDRLEFAKELGATHIINSRESDIAEEVLKILSGI
ncbi:zinc-binding dehydrogenase [Flavobacterium circumlabens]